MRRQGVLNHDLEVLRLTHFRGILSIETRHTPRQPPAGKDSYKFGRRSVFTGTRCNKSLSKNIEQYPERGRASEIIHPLSFDVALLICGILISNLSLIKSFFNQLIRIFFLFKLIITRIVPFFHMRFQKAFCNRD